MSTNNLPPFPSNVPTAPLVRLSLSKLQSHDVAESQRLLQACEDIGFFYLDLQDSTIGANLLTLADELFTLGENLFSLSLKEKQKFDFARQDSYHGYKAQGAVVVDRQGNLDANEFYNVSKNDILDLIPPLPSPLLLRHSRPMLKSFIHTSHTITILLLNHLNTHLSLPPSTLPNLHRLSALSGDQVRFIKSPAPVHSYSTRKATSTPTMGPHTDFGTLTILLNRLGGLQVLSPNSEEWTYVKPLPGHAIVNLGDAMVKFTNGRLRSNVHRVMRPPGEQGGCTRYSVVYFARAEDDVPLRRLEGEGIPKEEKGKGKEKVVSSKEWVLKRALGRRVDLGKGVDYDGTRGTEGGRY
ncbi:putative oxidoreductase, 2OG-Fe(II) oxygenase family [Aspergillus ibericus CBS 121593]|uniref:Oxidoreductase n=1 Tax=Aspergillus ibericus CBS 121593 TaxID=1448316 RepID=A0A395HG99_9EURO|nr:oxidoreductase [Aspergillus ibericus CBS 121593]RAL06155.1 oxidoreductase [Aspergillus ibericus CBS 121593]